MRADLRLKALWAWAGWIMVGIVITTCMLPGPTIAPVARLLPDKVEHGLAFFGMTVWFCGLYWRASWWKIAVGFVLLGAAIEVAQGVFTTTRAMELNDWFADSIGVAAALFVSAAGLSNWSVLVESRVFRLGKAQ